MRLSKYDFAVPCGPMSSKGSPVMSSQNHRLDRFHADHAQACKQVYWGSPGGLSLNHRNPPGREGDRPWSPNGKCGGQNKTRRKGECTLVAHGEPHRFPFGSALAP